MTRYAVFGQIAAVSFAVGCLALTALPQQQPTTRTRPTTENTQRSGVHFIVFSELDGKGVANSNGEEIGSISDVIVERGSSRAKFYVVKSGAVLGLGGRNTAIPVDAFGWDQANDRPTLNATAEQLTAMPEFTNEAWTELERTGSSNDLSRALSRESSWKQYDPYLTGEQGSLEKITLKGNITHVERRDSDAAGEEIVIHVATGDNQFGESGRPQPGTTRDRPTTDRPGMDRPGAQNQMNRGDVKVILGPSWYVMSRAEAPMRGYSFEGEVVPLQRAHGDAGYVAITAEINGEKLALRDDKTLKPLWTLSSMTGDEQQRSPGTPRPGDPRPDLDDRPLGDEDQNRPGAADRPRDMDRDVERDTERETDRDTRSRSGDMRSNQASNSARAPFFLLSEVDGATVEARGQDCGKVQDVVLDQPSGVVAFFVIDPDENFLGIADTTRLVPASVASFGSDDVVRIDASKEMVVQSKEMPDDLRTLEQGNAYEQVYRAYDVEAPKFQTRKQRGMDEFSSLGGWSSDGEFAKSVNGAKDVEVKGTVVRIERKEPSRGMSTATALVLNTDQGNRYVLLGPSWFVDQQDIPFKEGDQVTITAREATVDGQKMLVACSAHGEGGREIAFWDTDSKQPAWDRRR
jgi:sporulation protein YlmC with PRC-barrel domain